MRLKDVVAYEFIGQEIEIVEADNKSLIGIRGKIVDETKNTFEVESQGRTKTLLKYQITFTTTIENKKIKIAGNVLIGRPEERLKKRQ